MPKEIILKTGPRKTSIDRSKIELAVKQTNDYFASLGASTDSIIPIITSRFYKSKRNSAKLKAQKKTRRKLSK